MDTKNIWDAAENGPLMGLRFWLRANPLLLNVVYENKNYTPLHLAIRNENLKTTEYLIKEAKADVNQPSAHAHTTPLHEAVNINNISIVKILLENQAQLDLVDHENETPLHYAARKGNVEMIKLLMKKGANKDIWNKSLKKAEALVDESIRYCFLEYKG